MGHHFVPWHLFAKGTDRAKPIEIYVTDDVFAIFDEARISDEYYNFHGAGSGNGVSHARYNTLLKEKFEKFRETLAIERNYTKEKMIPLMDLNADDARAFVKSVEESNGEIKQFLDGIRYQVDMSKAIGKKGGKEAVVEWRKAHGKIEEARRRLREIAIGKRSNKSETFYLKQLATWQKKADDIALKYLSKSTILKIAKGFAKSGVVKKSAKTVFRVLPVFGFVSSVQEDGFALASLDEATDFIPLFWPVKLTARALIGEEEWARGRDMTWPERCDAFVGVWAALNARANKRERGESVEQFTLTSGQTVTVGVSKIGEINDPKNRGLSRVIGLYTVVGRPNEAIAALADGRVLVLSGPIKEVDDR